MQKDSSKKVDHVTDFRRRSKKDYEQGVASMLKRPLSREKMVRQAKRKMKEQIEKDLLK